MAAAVGFGVIGLGRMGALHAALLNGAVEGARLVAAVVDPDHRARLIAEGRAPCPLVDDVDALLRVPGVDAVVVASPSSLHHDHICRVAAAGKSIFAEKPLADSVALARQTAGRVKDAGVPFQIGFPRRFDPGYARARQLIDGGAIGTVEMFRALTCDRIPAIEFLRTSGGLFWDLAIHDFDAARFLTGDEVAAVFAVGTIEVEPRLSEFDDIDYGIVTLRFRHGAIGVAQSCWRAPQGYDIRAEVHGSEGKVVTEVEEQFPTRLYRAGHVSSQRHDEFVARFRFAYQAELQAFVDALVCEHSPTPGIDDAVRAVEIADAATRSRREGRWIELSS